MGDPRDPIEPAGPGADDAPPPDAPTGASSSALGADAPLDKTVVSFASRRRSRTDASAASAAAAAAPSPPKDDAAASKAGKGAKAGDKKEKTIDFGRLNFLVENFTLIYGTDTVWDASKRKIMKIANMAHAYGTDYVRMWKSSPNRRQVDEQDVVFDPTETCDPETTVNLFGGMALEPVEGDVAPILDLIAFLTSRVSDNDTECGKVMEWLLCWLAYPLQRPGAKLRTSVVMHGDEGAGKNFLFDMIVDIYGRYGALVGQDELEDKFNDWRSCKLFVVGDEVSSRAELVHNKNRLKALITSPTVQINPKNLPRREERNHMNVVFLSNELQPLALDNSDRRYLVVYTPRKKDFAYYKALAAWRDDGGAAAFYDYLLHYPLDDFDPFAPAPFTSAKADLIGINRKGPERFWADWSSGELELPYHSCSVDQLYQAYLKYAQRTGDRFPVQRPVFTPMVVRFAESQDKFAQVKVMKIETEGARKAHRMFLVCEPPADQPQGDWASEAVKHFQKHLQGYLHGWSRSPDGGDSGEGEAR